MLALQVVFSCGPAGHGSSGVLSCNDTGESYFIIIKYFAMADGDYQSPFMMSEMKPTSLTCCLTVIVWIVTIEIFCLGLLLSLVTL
jgi:hypothetical protein